MTPEQGRVGRIRSGQGREDDHRWDPSAKRVVKTRGAGIRAISCRPARREIVAYIPPAAGLPKPPVLSCSSVLRDIQCLLYLSPGNGLENHLINSITASPPAWMVRHAVISTARAACRAPSGRGMPAGGGFPRRFGASTRVASDRARTGLRTTPKRSPQCPLHSDNRVRRP